MHSIELLLDRASDEAVRRQWLALAEAGLHSLHRHSGATNAPHVTLLARPAISDRFDDDLRRISEALPVPAALGALVVFGAPPRGLVLARPVTVGPGILRLHADVNEVAGAADDSPHTRPGRWTPHVTLASRLTPEELAQAVEVLAATTSEADEESLASATAFTLRRWDSTERTVTPLDGTGSPPTGASTQAGLPEERPNGI